jgi:hypothetical protein
MDGSVEEAFIKNTRAIVGGIKTAIEVEIGASEVQTNLFGYPLQRFQALREQDHVGLVDGRHGDRRYDVAMVVRDGDDFLAFLVLVV